jgi:hypothetical protein
LCVRGLAPSQAICAETGLYSASGRLLLRADTPILSQIDQRARLT